MGAPDLPGMGETIRRVMMLDGSIFVTYQEAGNGLLVALGLVALAGLSKFLGQSVILFVNHVRPLRFSLALLFGVVQHVLGFVLWATTIWLVGYYGFDASVAWRAVATAVGVAYAPQILAFFELTPFFGNPFGLLLTLWSLLAIVVGVQAGLGLSIGQAVLACGVGWLLLQVLSRTLGRPIYTLGRWIERKVAGSSLQYSLQDLPHLRRSLTWQRHWQARLRRQRAAGP
jgi:hypothetical protein